MDKLDNANIRKKLGENIRTLRKSRGYSQMKFAEAIGFGVTQAAVSAWEVGIREPELYVIFSIADKFKVPVSYLIPMDASGMEEDVTRKDIDTLNQNPILREALNKMQYFDESKMSVVFSVVDAITKNSEQN